MIRRTVSLEDEKTSNKKTSSEAPSEKDPSRIKLSSFPTSWEEFCGSCGFTEGDLLFQVGYSTIETHLVNGTETIKNTVFVNTKYQAKGVEALCKLIRLRDAWNSVDGFEVDWEINQTRYSVVLDVTETGIFYIEVIDSMMTEPHMFTFGTEDTAELFADCFESLFQDLFDLYIG